MSGLSTLVTLAELKNFIPKKVFPFIRRQYEKMPKPVRVGLIITMTLVIFCGAVILLVPPEPNRVMVTGIDIAKYCDTAMRHESGMLDNDQNPKSVICFTAIALDRSTAVNMIDACVYHNPRFRDQVFRFSYTSESLTSGHCYLATTGQDLKGMNDLSGYCQDALHDKETIARSDLKANGKSFWACATEKDLNSACSWSNGGSRDVTAQYVSGSVKCFKTED